MFSDAGSQDYTEEFHNAYWSGVATGMATTSFWWDFTQDRTYNVNPPIFTDERMETYRNVRGFVSGIDFAQVPYEPVDIAFRGTKACAMAVDTSGFAWLWTHGPDVSGREVRMEGLETGSYETLWYNTWTGEAVTRDTAAAVHGVLPGVTPRLDHERRDIAFKSRRLADGTEASKLSLFSKEAIINSALDTTYAIVCYVGDDQGRLVPAAGHEVSFTLVGPGSLSDETVTAAGGVAAVTYLPDAESEGPIAITAEAAGLEHAILAAHVVTDLEAARGQQVPSEFVLQPNYLNPFNPATTILYSVSEPTHVTLRVYDAIGRKVRTLVQGHQNIGNYEVTFDADCLPSANLSS